MRASKNEYPCCLLNMSVGGALISSPVSLDLDERIVVYFDELGGLEGHVVRQLDTGFAIEFAATQRKRQKLAAQLTWLINRHEAGLQDLRKPGHERRVLENTTITVRHENGDSEECKALDVSISGASLQGHSKPPIGTIITVANLRAKVVRHHANGFGVAFVELQKSEAIRKHFG